MTSIELDEAYTALCRTLGTAGENQAPLVLARLALLLIERHADLHAVLGMIEAAADVRANGNEGNQHAAFDSLAAR